MNINYEFYQFQVIFLLLLFFFFVFKLNKNFKYLFNKFKGVENAELRIWSLKSNMYAISIKFTAYEKENYDEIAEKIKSLLKSDEIFKFICFEI